MFPVPGPFYNIVGTPTTPAFAEFVLYGYTDESAGGTKPMRNIFHFRAQTPVAGGSETTLANNIYGAIAGVYEGLFTADFHLPFALCRFMDNPTNAGSSIVIGTVGTNGGDRGPSFQAGVIRKLSGVRGRHWRGSNHYGAVPEAFTTKDELNVTGQAAYDALVTSFGTWLAGVSDGVNLWYPIILSPSQSNLIANPSIFTGAPVSTYGRNLKLGTMKRRKEKNIVP